MIYDIFSRFDDHNRVFIDLNYLIWGLSLTIILFVTQILWSKSSFFIAIVTRAMAIVEDLVSRTEAKMIGGSSSLFIRLFIILVTLNLIGLVPFVFRLTRHLSINLALSLPTWLAVVLIRRAYRISSFLAHLQPSGSPTLLNPFLCVIELVRLLVRPLTLAVRLTANLRTGHILIALLGTGFISTAPVVSFIILVLGAFYFTFEMAVCCIQAYIFTLLPTLYRDEHPLD